MGVTIGQLVQLPTGETGWVIKTARPDEYAHGFPYGDATVLVEMRQDGELIHGYFRPDELQIIDATDPR